MLFSDAQPMAGLLLQKLLHARLIEFMQCRFAEQCCTLVRS